MVRYGNLAGVIVTAVTAVLVLCQCEAKRTVKRTRTSFAINDSPSGSPAPSSSGQNKIATRGYSIGDDGSIKADRPDLFSGQKARGVDGEFSTKTARFKNQHARTKEFKTPEYIKRQEFKGTSQARESSQAAREGDFGRSRDRASGQLFRRGSSTDTGALSSFQTGAHRGSDRQYATRSDRTGSQAVSQAPRAMGVSQMAGFKPNSALTVDDVKKMLNPSAFSGN